MLILKFGYEIQIIVQFGYEINTRNTESQEHKHQPQIEMHHQSDLLVFVSSGQFSDAIKAIFLVRYFMQNFTFLYASITCPSKYFLTGNVLSISNVRIHGSKVMDWFCSRLRSIRASKHFSMKYNLQRIKEMLVKKCKLIFQPGSKLL